MFCSSCGAENEEGKKFCADCGAELVTGRPAAKAAPPEEKKQAGPQVCSDCGAENEEGKKFCADCGTQMGAAPTPARAAAPPKKKEQAVASFWNSGPGIAVIAIAGIAVLAGITLGIVFAVKGGGSDSGSSKTSTSKSNVSESDDNGGTDLAAELNALEADISKLLDIKTAEKGFEAVDAAYEQVQDSYSAVKDSAQGDKGVDLSGLKAAYQTMETAYQDSVDAVSGDAGVEEFKVKFKAFLDAVENFQAEVKDLKGK